MSKPTDAQIAAAVRAARHFTFVANGRLNRTNTPAAFKRDAQALADALAVLGFLPQTTDEVAQAA